MDAKLENLSQTQSKGTRWKQNRIPDIWNAVCSDSDRISHRCAMPFPDVRHGIAFGAANAQALSRLWRSVLGINGKSRLVRPTGAVLLKSLPDGAVFGAKCMIFRTDRQCFGWKAACRCLLSAETGIFEIHNKGSTGKAGWSFTLLPWWHGNQDFIRDRFSDEWATEHHATAFSIKKHDDFLIETHGNCRKYAILHDSQSLDQKIGGYFDRRTTSSGLKRYFA